MHDRWSRLSILDLLLLTLAFAVIPAWYSRHPEWLAPGLTVAEHAVWVFLLGGMASAPPVLLSQCALRGRRADLSLGEWCWLAQPAIYLAALTAAALSPPSPGPLLLWFSLAVLASTLAFVALFSEALNSSDAACTWTDRFGKLLCAFAGPWLIVEFFLRARLY